VKRLGLVPLLAVAGFTLGREGMGGWVAHNNRTGWLAVAAACLKGKHYDRDSCVFCLGCRPLHRPSSCPL